MSKTLYTCDVSVKRPKRAEDGTKLRDARGMTVQETIKARVEVAIDIGEIVTRIGRKAAANRTGRASAYSSLVKAKVLSREVSSPHGA